MNLGHIRISSAPFANVAIYPVCEYVYGYMCGDGYLHVNVFYIHILICMYLFSYWCIYIYIYMRTSTYSADGQFSNYIWVINNFIAEGASYIRGLMGISLSIKYLHRSQNCSTCHLSFCNRTLPLDSFITWLEIRDASDKQTHIINHVTFLIVKWMLPSPRQQLRHWKRFDKWCPIYCAVISIALLRSSAVWYTNSVEEQ